MSQGYFSPEDSFTVDLDAEKGGIPRIGGKPDRDKKHRVVINFAKQVHLAAYAGAHLPGL